MKRILLNALLLCFLLTGSGWGADFSLLLNDDSVQGRLSIPVDKNEYGDSIVGLRILYNEDEEALLGSVFGGVNGAPGNIPGLKIGAEILANSGSSDNDRKIMAVGLGLTASYQPPQLQGGGVFARVQYAPELLSFMDSEDLFEYAVGISYMVTPKATLSLEYQNIEIDFDTTGDRDIDDSLRAGVIFHF